MMLMGLISPTEGHFYVDSHVFIRVITFLTFTVEITYFFSPSERIFSIPRLLRI